MTSEAPERLYLQPCPAAGWSMPDRVKYNTGHAVEYFHQQALEAAEARGYARAANNADKLGYHCIGCGHICGDPKKDMRILRKAGARSCCPEREMEPLSEAIRARPALDPHHRKADG